MIPFPDARLARQIAFIVEIDKLLAVKEKDLMAV